MFPERRPGGTSLNTPQTTEQTKWQFRDDFSWTMTGGRVSATTSKAGVNFIHEPRLFVNVAQGTSGVFTMGNDVNGPITDILSDWRQHRAQHSDRLVRRLRAGRLAREQRLTLNLGVRWDYVDGIPFDQSRNPNFQALQAAGRRDASSARPSRTSARSTQTTATTFSRAWDSCMTCTAPDARSFAADGASTLTSRTPTQTS